MRILVVNAGSSSLKLRVIESDDTVAHAEDLPAVGRGTTSADISSAVAAYGSLDAIGHRVVHGGYKFTAPVRIDKSTTDELARLVDLAPLHQPMALAAIAAVSKALHSVPAVACFDTAFHAGLPVAASTYALPREWREKWVLRRFGFHGLSHSYASNQLARLMGRPIEGLCLITCHLGAGASLAAIQGGISVDTTMGFTPLEGLVMATRSGSIDPGLLLWLVTTAGLTSAELADGLENHSGLLGMAGSADMREVSEAAAVGNADAQLALDIYLHRLRAGIAAMTASLGRLDGLVFTGGVGENSSTVRAGAIESLGHLGLTLDRTRDQARGDREISEEGAPVFVAVISAREDLQIAREVRLVLDNST